MTFFLDLRLAAVGGEPALTPALFAGTTIDTYGTIALADFQAAVQGRHVLLGTHGFNVPRAAGILALSQWESQLQLTDPALFVGVLWPGDSIWAHGLDFPLEPAVANTSGDRLATFLDANLGSAASLSFVSHSLGARVILSAVSAMKRRTRQVILMAGAVDDDCLNNEFKAITDTVDGISILASHKDEVLSNLFPLGDLIGRLLTFNHPWWRGAIGRDGPQNPPPDVFRQPYMIPDSWNFGHGDYLKLAPQHPAVPLDIDIPPGGTPEPGGGVDGWQSAWSASVASERFD